MPRASRANGERIWVAGARCGFPFLLAGAFLEGARFEDGFLLPALLRGRLDARDDERRDGEVFVAMRGSV
jgi:hypothetical protein